MFLVLFLKRTIPQPVVEAMLFEIGWEVIQAEKSSLGIKSRLAGHSQDISGAQAL
jgi:hypothetical protein